MDCTDQNIVIPVLLGDPCRGVTTSSDCVIYKLAITSLLLPPNSTQTQVTNALLASLVDSRQRILDLEERLDNL